MSTAEDALPVSDAEADVLFAGIGSAPGLVLAVSGGPDSTALLVLAAAWRQRHRDGPRLTAVTVDNGLRAEARQEARTVKALAKELGYTGDTSDTATMNEWLHQKVMENIQQHGGKLDLGEH